MSHRIPAVLLGSLTLVAGPKPVLGQDATAALEITFDAAPAGPVCLYAPGLERRAEPDAQGRVLFLHLPPGAYRVDGCAAIVEVRQGEREAVRCASSEAPGSASTKAPPHTRGFRAATAFDHDHLRTIPRPADPWSVLRDVPGVVVDRVNVGGSDSEQQALLVSHGDPGQGATWSLDGVDVTDPGAPGSSLLYPDMDALETLTARTGALDVRVRTPGVQIGLAVRSPRERLSGAAHVRGSWAGLQSDNLPEDLAGRPFYRNQTEGVSELGAELQGPVGDGRGWLFGSFYRNTLAQETFTEHEEHLRTSAVTVRGRVRLGRGALRMLATRADKVHEDRDTGLQSEGAARWRQKGPTLVLALEHHQPWGRSSILTHLSWADGGFRLEPQGGTQPSAFEDFRGVLRRSYSSFETERRRLRGGAELTTQRRAFGASHALLAGFDFSHAPVETHQAWPGNGVLGLERQGVFFRAFRLTGFALPYRESTARVVTDSISLHGSDELRFSRFTATLGLRLERLSGGNRPSAVRANPAFPDLLPAVSYDGSGQGIRFLDLLPRLGLAAALGTRTTARAGYAAYGAPLGSNEASFDNPLRDFASLTYYWKDANADTVVQQGELDLVRGRLGSSGFDPDRPGVAESPNRIAPGLREPRTHEVFAAAERRLGATGEITLRASYRRLENALWRPLRGLLLADYVARGAVHGTLFNEDYAVTYFAPASTSQIEPGNGRVLSNREGYAQDTFVVEATARGRLTAAFDGQAWASWTDWRELFFDRETAVQDPTPTDTEPLVDGGLPVVRPGGLGRGDLFVGARFVAGATLRARLPLDLRAAARLHIREGFPVPYFQVASTGDPTAASKNVLITGTLDRYRLPGLVLLDLRLERGFAIGRGRLTAGLDVWNATNAATSLQVARDVELPAFDRPRELVRPRLLRLGVEFSF